jgi:hypothetical protein
VLPAQASTTSSLCTVTPQAPGFDHLDSSGQKVIKYATTVYCQSGRPIEIQDQRWDDDTWDFIPSADDPYGITTYNPRRPRPLAYPGDEMSGCQGHSRSRWPSAALVPG